MTRNSLFKYKVGLACISIFVIALLIVVLSQASATKEDTNTYNSALNISNTLNDYTADQGIIPSNLTQAGVNNVPPTITFQKLSESSYKFCVYYKTSSSDFSPSDIETNLITNNVVDSGSSGDSGGNYYLTIDTTHHKGNNCQTVQLMNYNLDNTQED